MDASDKITWLELMLIGRPIAAHVHQNFQRIRRRVAGQLDGGRSFIQSKRMGDEFAQVELTAEHEAGDFALEGEIGRIAADEIFLVHADGSEIQLRVVS